MCHGRQALPAELESEEASWERHLESTFIANTMRKLAIKLKAAVHLLRLSNSQGTPPF